MTDLLTADYTFINEQVALIYGFTDIRGNGFHRVTLTDPKRYGLLGKGAVLMLTANPNRTAPVLRGAWILERILGTPPADPAAQRAGPRTTPVTAARPPRCASRPRSTAATRPAPAAMP